MNRDPSSKLPSLEEDESSSDSDEEEFEEVPEFSEKEGYEPHIPEHLRAEYGK